ncbi:MAG TPA: TlpA disulfide reductase family protein [Oleiagrimonas sp.]|nr:TlpA disulfide reductase family protein [Oleiagrimonas sp.]
MQAISVGPWVLSVGVLALLLGLAGAHGVAGFMRRRGHADTGAVLWWLLLVALLAARVAYVLRWWSAYSASPWWSVLDVRDAGFNPWVGLVVLVLATALLAWRRRAWRRALPVAVIGGVCVWAIVGLVAWQLRASAPPPLPEVALQRLDGDRIDLASLRGKPMVINLWATWCGPCRREMPMLMEAAADMHGVRFVFANQGESAAAVRAYLAREQLASARVVLDTGRDLARYYHAVGYPTTLFLDADGRLRDMRVGPLSRASLQAHLRFITSSSTPVND